MAQELKITLDLYEGPLDLLLDLIRRQKLDIYDIPIADVTAQYLDYLHLMKDMNVKQMFRDLGLTHTFSCSRTLNDNLYVESLFGTMKTNPVYPGLFSFEVESWFRDILADMLISITNNTTAHALRM